MKTESRYTAALGRTVELRPGTSDEQVHADTFGGAGQYHVPPATMPTPLTVVDLGANIGLTAAHYRALWPGAEVVAVEMDEDNAELARRNAPEVIVRAHAVSDQAGLGWYDPHRPAEALALEGYYSGGLMPTTRSVQVRTLRQVILRSFGGPVDFVKMDVEGAEWRILRRPDWATLVRYLLVEVHDPDLSPDASARLVADAISLLDAAGFDARHHPPHPRAVWAVRR